MIYLTATLSGARLNLIDSTCLFKLVLKKTLIA